MGMMLRRRKRIVVEPQPEVAVERANTVEPASTPVKAEKPKTNRRKAKK